MNDVPKSSVKAKVGLIIDDYFVNGRLKELIELSQQSESYKISHVIIQKTKRNDDQSLLKQIREYIQRRGLKKFIDNASFRVLLKAEKLLLSRLEKVKKFYQEYDVRVFDVEVIVVEPKVSKSGLIYRYNEDDLAQIRAQGLSLLIRGGGGILRGKVLNVCPHGIISFHHADNDVNRGTPPGFWEVYHRQSETGFIIQLLKDELDGGDVIYKGSIATQFIYTLNLEHLFTKSNVFMHQTIDRLLGEGEVQLYPKKPYAYQLFTLPSVLEQAAYLWQTALFVAKKGWRRAQGKRLRWGVAYQYCQDWRDVTLRKSKRIPNPPHRFFADPFLFFHQDTHYCFVEDYDLREAKGRISVIEISPSGTRELGIALEEPFHLSFPYVFEHEGEIYMCPESHQSKEVRLYKCQEFPLKWTLAEVLLSDIDAADTMIFKQDGLWWLMTNICSARLNDHCSELHLYSSPNLLKGHWSPHPHNPVIFNARQGRNGGLIQDKQKIYRVFQQQGWAVYGESFGVASVETLSSLDYQEQELFTVAPSFFPTLEGTHTYNYQAGLMVIDFVEVDRYR